MALPVVIPTAVIHMSASEQEEAFMDHARYNPDSPPGRGYQYSIRVGSQVLWSDDTLDLRKEFNRHVGILRRLHRMTNRSNVGRRGR